MPECLRGKSAMDDLSISNARVMTFCRNKQHRRLRPSETLKLRKWRERIFFSSKEINVNTIWEVPSAVAFLCSRYYCKKESTYFITFYAFIIIIIIIVGLNIVRMVVFLFRHKAVHMRF